MRVPLVDIQAEQREVASAVRAGWDRVLERGQFILSDEVVAFETEFARFAGVDHCVGVGNGTDAVELALRALGIGPGDEVIVPANTFIASVLAVMRAGATPVLVDVDERFLLIDPSGAGERVTSRTRAVLPVHLYGQMAPVEQLAALDLGTDVHLVEDAAQAHGARRNGTPAGGFGRVTATSFYPTKNLGAYGDAGAVLTNDDEVATTVRALRNYGSDVKYHHPEVGFNSRLDALQAVVLTAKLGRLEEWTAARRTAAARYHALLDGLDGVRRPEELPGNYHVWHLYVVRVAERDRVLGELEAAGIEAAVHYPVPVHLQGALRALDYSEGDFPVTEQAASEILSLPMFPGITADQQEQVANGLRGAVRRAGG